MQMSDDPRQRIAEEMELHRQEQAEAEAAGVPALQRLVEIAKGDSGQASHIRAFLLGLYNGKAYPFDLTRMRPLDRAIQADVLAVLRMDMRPRQEVHCYIEGGSELFESWRD